MQEHVTHAYEALRNMLEREGVQHTMTIDVDCLIIEQPDNTSIRVYHPDANANGSEAGWAIDYGHAEDAAQRMQLMGRPAISFRDLGQIVSIAMCLLQLKAYPTA